MSQNYNVLAKAYPKDRDKEPGVRDRAKVDQEVDHLVAPELFGAPDSSGEDSRPTTSREILDAARAVLDLKTLVARIDFACSGFARDVRDVGNGSAVESGTFGGAASARVD